MIVATAGHVDHGKTSLVRALTGIDPDRLPEEKRRGMTIEPGFAHAELGGAGPVAFVDVPGHERFVRHMLAGVSGAEAALLVIAADDGPMPQTREHLCVLDLLGLRRGAIVVTKIDRVSPERLAEVLLQIDTLITGTSLKGAPVFPLSTVTGEGLDALRGHLVKCQRERPTRDDRGPARFTIDRSFTRPGAGLVVTGTLLVGQVQVGDTLRVSPSGSAVRVRGLQVHGRSSEAAHAGQRCALNLVAAGADRLELERGDWLLAPDTHAPSARLDVMLHWLASAPRPLTGDAVLQLHLGATERTVRVVPLSQSRLEPGQQGPAQLVLDRPVSALHGDRLVLRDTTARQIVGGAVVLDPWAPSRGRSRPERLAALDALAVPDPREALVRLLDSQAGGVDWPAFARARQLPAQAWQTWPEAYDLEAVKLPTGLQLLSASRWQALQARAVTALATVHAESPDSVGLPEASLLRAMDAALDVGLRRAALRAQLQAGHIVRDGFVLRLPGHEPRLQPEDESLLARVVAILQPLGLRPLPPGELAPLLEMELKPLSAFLQRAAALGHLVQVAKNRFFLPTTIEALVEVARQCAAVAPDGRFDARSFRDASGIGRNLTIQLLEFFDRSGLTRYAAERRSMAPDNEG